MALAQLVLRISKGLRDAICGRTQIPLGLIDSRRRNQLSDDFGRQKMAWDGDRAGLGTLSLSFPLAFGHICVWKRSQSLVYACLEVRPFLKLIHCTARVQGFR